MQRLLISLLAAASGPLAVRGGGNGWPNSLAQTPPRGWRSWNAVLGGINDTFIRAVADALVLRRHSLDGVPTSLADLGYNRVGLDDAWEACGQGVNGSFHNAAGVMLWDAVKFPDVQGMVDYVHSLGLFIDHYDNNDGCCEAGKVGPHYEQDAAFLAAHGFDGAKFDSCGPAPNMTEWAVAFNKTGRQMLIENCNNQDPFRPTVQPDGSVFCPFNMFRTSIDNSPNFLSGVSNLLDSVAFFNVSGPGCWA